MASLNAVQVPGNDARGADYTLRVLDLPFSIWVSTVATIWASDQTLDELFDDRRAFWAFRGYLWVKDSYLLKIHVFLD